MTSMQNLGRAFSRSAPVFHSLSGRARNSSNATRSLSAMMTRRDGATEVSKRNRFSLSAVYRQHQQRTMVMVTKTKTSELTTEQEEADQSPSSKLSEAVDYKVLNGDLIVTPSCLAQVEKLIQQRKAKDGENSFLRVFVDAGGCSGFTYQFEFDQEFDPDEDITLVTSSSSDEDTPRVVVDETSLGFLKGSTLDYVQEMIKSSFVVADNPQSESACGCGSSFAMKNFEANPALD
jgi:iron-sulfur cluster assembly accessory protein